MDRRRSYNGKSFPVVYMLPEDNTKHFSSFYQKNGIEWNDVIQQQACEKWDMMIDSIVGALYDMYFSDDITYQYSKEAHERTTLAMNLFAEHFRGLWW